MRTTIVQEGFGLIEGGIVTVLASCSPNGSTINSTSQEGVDLVSFHPSALSRSFSFRVFENYHVIKSKVAIELD